ncbi:hypothetical protein MACH17_18280 [Phaeobacter inhibens]|uniref:hypothetical protein n=1 Tax=Phaeobacter inhibens TaxID=221822 RepID=UPI00276A10EB|nr:hypothetical protein [Phaeobacter inhibens]GLO70311.1 hypothetical protein MACH17_18280 [Phaeobacter inhibens]
MSDLKLENRISALEAELARLREIMQIDPATGEDRTEFLNSLLQAETREDLRERHKCYREDSHKRMSKPVFDGMSMLDILDVIKAHECQSEQD